MTDETQTQATESQDPKELIPRYRYNEKAKELEDAQALIAKFQREQAEINERKLAEQGKHEELIATLKPKAERAESLEASIKTLVADELSNIVDEERRASIADVLAAIPEPDKQLLALRKLSQFVTPPNRPTPAPMDGGKGSRTPNPNRTPTPEELAAAQWGGIPIETYMKTKYGD